MAINAEVFQFLLNQQRNSAGMLDSGTVTFYETGTTTLKTVWTDRAKGTPASNPVTLDSNASTEIYGDGVYRVVIKDSTGSTVNDIDDVELSLDTAAVSAAAAAASATAASDSSDLAQEWAENPEDSAVTGFPGQYSALHWAAKATTTILPTGSIIPFGSTTPPTGFLACDGSAVSRVTYATLFGVIATDFGIGDGTSTFNLPDLRGEFIRGLDGSRGVDPGRTINDPQAEEIGPHTHDTKYWADVSLAGNYPERTSLTGSELLIASEENSGAENRPRNIALPFIIKT